MEPPHPPFSLIPGQVYPGSTTERLLQARLEFLVDKLFEDAKYSIDNDTTFKFFWKICVDYSLSEESQDKLLEMFTSKFARDLLFPLRERLRKKRHDVARGKVTPDDHIQAMYDFGPDVGPRNDWDTRGLYNNRIAQEIYRRTIYILSNPEAVADKAIEVCEINGLSRVDAMGVLLRFIHIAEARSSYINDEVDSFQTRVTTRFFSRYRIDTTQTQVKPTCVTCGKIQR